MRKSDGKNERVDRMGSSIYSSKDNESLHKSLNGEFILYQILLNQMLDKKNSTLLSHSSLLKHFNPDDPNDQKNMNEFDDKYDAKKAIHWYTRDTCIYKILNKALRTQNIDDVIPFKHFIQDLNAQLSQEHTSFIKKQQTAYFQLYRGQFISKDELLRLKSAKDQFIAMNSFLSTSTNRKKALEFATSRPPPNDELTTILLEIEVDLYVLSKPYADIKHLSAFAEEEEILFMLGSVFRIGDIHFDEKNKLWIAKLFLCSQNDQDFQDFAKNLDQELKGQSPFIALGNYFIQMLKYEEAQEHFENIIKNKLTKDDIELAYCYYGISQVNQKKQDYRSAISNINKVLSHLANHSSTNDHELISQSYNDLGSIYTQQKDYIMATQSYEKALKIKNNITSNSYSGLSQIQTKIGNFTLAHEYLQKSLYYQPKTAYTSIANTFIDMGKNYMAMNQKDKASQMFGKAIESQLKVVGPNHPDLGYTYIAIGLMYSDINEEQKAFQYIEKAHQIQLGYLPNNHPDFALTYISFGDLYMKKEDFDQALSYYHKALENQLKTLLWNHPAVAETYKTIGLVHWKKKEYERATVYFHKIVDSDLSRKKFGDPSLSTAFKDIADLYFEKDDLDQSLIFYVKSLENELETKLHLDASLADLYKIIADIYYRKRVLNQALSYYNRLLDCHLQKQPYDEKAIEEIYTFIGKVYLKKRHFDQKLLIYDKIKINNSKDVNNVHFERRHLDEAYIYFQEHLKQQLKTHSETDPLIGHIYQILANIYFEKGEFDQSLNYFIKLLNNKLKKHPIDDPSLRNIYKAIGSIYFEKNLLNEALIYFNRFIDCQLFKSNDEIYQLIGKIYLKKDNINESSNYINKLIEKKSKNNQLETNFQYEKRHLKQNLFYFQNLLTKKSFEYFTLEQIYFIIANLFLEKQDFHQALFYFQNSLFQTNSLSYFSLAKTNEIIAKIHEKQFNLYQSLQYYRQCLYFYQKLNPINQLLINNIKYQINQILNSIRFYQ